MAAILETGTGEPFGRFRFRGFDPKAVERWAAMFEQEKAGLRAQIAALEARAVRADAFAEEALVEASTLRDRLAQLEMEREEFAIRQRMFRDEAAQIIHDAWTEANTVRAQAQQRADETQAQIAATRAAHTAEIERMRAAAVAEIEAAAGDAQRAITASLEHHHAQTRAELVVHRSEIAALEEQRARLVAEIEACTARMLGEIAPLKAALPSAAAETQDDGREDAATRAAREAAESLALLAPTMRYALEALPPYGNEAYEAMDAVAMGDFPVV